MPTRAMFVLPGNAISVEEPFHQSGSHIQFQQGQNVYAVRRVRCATDVRTDMTYEVYADQEIADPDALERAARWNEEFPHLAVPPKGFMA
jgi:hypothetical protein